MRQRKVEANLFIWICFATLKKGRQYLRWHLPNALMGGLEKIIA